MGGVVNIITMRPSKLFEGDIAAGISQDDTYDLGLNLGSRVGMFYFMAGGTMSDSDGYRLSRKFEPTLNEDGDVRFNSDRDEEAGSFKIGFIPAEGHEYAVGVNHVNSEWGLPPHTTDRARYWRFSDWEKTTYYFLGDTRITDKLSMKTRLFRDEYENVLDSYDDDTFTTQDMGYAFHSIYDDYSNGGSVIVQTGYIPMNTFSLGFIYKEDVHREKDDYETEWEQYEAETYSFVAEDEFKITEDLSLVAGAAYDINKAKYANGAELRDDEKSFNPMGGVNWYVFDYTRLHASVGKKTRFPTLQELYSGYFGRNEPNPYLEEERAINYEAGIEQEIPCLETTVSFSVFRSDIKDLIVRREIAPKVDQYQNIGMARYQGFETSLKSEFLKNNRLEVHYTYLDAENRSHGRTSDHLEERPKHNLYISDLYTPIWWLSFFAKFQYNSRRLEENTDTLEWEKVAGFWTVDGKVIVRVAKNVAIEAGARNIFDDNYELRSGYPREGRSLFALARVTF
jgi:iron complex outermembrane receptor protein